MAAYTKDEALAFITALRLVLGRKVGFKHFGEKLSGLADYVESLAVDNERMKGYLEQLDAGHGYESYLAARSGASASDEVPGPDGGSASRPVPDRTTGAS